MTWDSTIKEFETDSEYRAKKWEQEKLRENRNDFEGMEQRMERKHCELVANLDRWQAKIESIFMQRQAQGMYNPGQFSASSYSNVLTGYSEQTPPPSQVNNRVENQGFNRPRLNSNKRRRNEDGSATEVIHVVHESQLQEVHRHSDGGQLTQKSASSRTADLKSKSIVGTSDSITAGRKMRSPPADIFV